MASAGTETTRYVRVHVDGATQLTLDQMAELVAAARGQGLPGSSRLKWNPGNTWARIEHHDVEPVRPDVQLADA